ncbi:MAG: peptidoglycan editing factor PgeF [Candidatus Cloacimonetes bacterium]|nr:peptidoglycan editing factor PgeF [Candidatus Cloacimonadota bacterium]
MKIFVHLGKREPDYRNLMREQSDFTLDGITIPASRLVIADQTHSRQVHICREADCGAGLGDKPQIPIVDGLITNIPGQFLLIRTADCTPVILADKEKMVVSALHSGREGTRKNIVEEAVSIMNTHYQCQPKDIVAYIGAGISASHYQVSQGIYDEFVASVTQQGFAHQQDNQRRLDIRHIIFQQLIKAGIPFRNIENIHDCTYENPDYHSYRREGTHNRQINIVGILT